eukprot:gene26953-3826_t
MVQHKFQHNVIPEWGTQAAEVRIPVGVVRHARSGGGLSLGGDVPLDRNPRAQAEGRLGAETDLGGTLSTALGKASGGNDLGQGIAVVGYWSRSVQVKGVLTCEILRTPASVPFTIFSGGQRHFGHLTRRCLRVQSKLVSARVHSFKNASLPLWSLESQCASLRPKAALPSERPGFSVPGDFLPSLRAAALDVSTRKTDELGFILNEGQCPYLARDSLFVAGLAVGFSALNAWWAWPAYWFMQGTMFWSLFVVGHDCGHAKLLHNKHCLNDLILQFAIFGAYPPLEMFAFPFYLWKRTPGKTGSHYDPNSDLFVPSERKQFVT